MKTAGGAAATLGIAACKEAASQAGLNTRSEDGPEAMEMRTNPNSGDRVSILGYGCMRWQMTKDANGRDIVDQDSVNELVDYAIAHGVNYFDTSPVYLQGQSEAATAKALLRHPREKYFIATKMSNFQGHSREASLAMYQRSFEIFQTDRMDYYLLHSLSGEGDFKRRFLDNGMIDFLVSEREAGRIRNLGFSFHGPVQGFDYMMSLHEKYHWDFVQIQMNYVDWNHAQGRNVNASYLYKELTDRGIPVVIMEPLLGGRLSSVPDPVAVRLKEHAPGKSIASWAFRFCGTYPGVLTALSGMTYMEHLADNCDTYCHFKPLTEEEKDLLEEMALMIRDFPLVNCTACNYCMPCPYGIDIPGIFTTYNKAVNQGLVAESAQQSDFKQLRRRYLALYDKSVETIRQADHCINCGQCQPHCPQNIRIPRELARIDGYVEKLKRGTL